MSLMNDPINREKDMSTMTEEAVWTEFQAPPEESGLFAEATENLKWWAEVNNDPVADGVDAQASILYRHQSFPDRPRAQFVLWTANTWCTSGAGKEYLGNVMRYKKSRLAATAAEEAPVDPKDQQIETLTRLNEEKQNTINNLLHDLEVITDRLAEEAQERDWCSEYETFVDRVNRNMRVFQIPPRSRLYQVTWEETYRITVRRSEMVSAVDADAAIEEVQGGDDNLDESTYRWSTPEGEPSNVEYDDSDDWSAEEA
jgi:hypothetical protein